MNNEKKEGQYTLQAVSKLPKRGNANYLYFLNEEKPLKALHEWDSKGGYNEIALGGAGGNLKAHVELVDDQINFPGDRSADIEIIPAQEGKIILVKKIMIESLLDTPISQAYISAYIAYALPSGLIMNLRTLDVNSATDRLIYENVNFNKGNEDITQQPIGAPLIVTGTSGTGMSGATGSIHITVEYEYYTAYKTS